MQHDLVGIIISSILVSEMSLPPLFVVSCRSCHLTCPSIRGSRFIGASSAWRLSCGRPPSATRSQQCPVHHSGQRLTLWTCSSTFVTDHISSSFCPSAQGDVGVFCTVLVRLLRGSRTGTLCRFGNIAGGVPIESVSEDLSIIKSKGQQQRFPRLRRTACMTEQ
jgi:hypothetical protein